MGIGPICSSPQCYYNQELLRFNCFSKVEQNRKFYDFFSHAQFAIDGIRVLLPRKVRNFKSLYSVNVSVESNFVSAHRRN